MITVLFATCEAQTRRYLRILYTLIMFGLGGRIIEHAEASCSPRMQSLSQDISYASPAASGLHLVLHPFEVEAEVGEEHGEEAIEPSVAQTPAEAE